MAHRQTSVQVISKIQARIREVLAPLTPEDGHFALLDFPNHGNVGDSAIWLGEIAYFRAVHQCSPAYLSDIRAFSADQLEDVLPGKAPIFIHGGGNFGDLWPHHQEFREYVTARFPNRPIVQLPQSIHFCSEQKRCQAARAIHAHPNFTLLVRDRQSLAIAQKHFPCRTELCPDMAFYLGPLTRPIAPVRPLLLLLRTDKERVVAADGAPDIPPAALVADWVRDEPRLRCRIRRPYMLTLLPRLGTGALLKSRRRQFRYELLARSRLLRGLKLLSSARFVISDRLHAHILSVLLNLPHVALDNSYGKISSFIREWTWDCEIVQTETSLQTSLELVEQSERFSASGEAV